MTYIYLDSLVNQKDFFQLKDQYKKLKEGISPEQQLYIEANIHNVFNRPQKSNDQIELLLKKANHFLTDSTLFQIYKSKLNNHINLYEYEEASLCSEIILDKFQNIGDSIELVRTYDDICYLKSETTDPIFQTKVLLH